MLSVYTSSWWALLLRGIAAVLFGVLAFVWPGITLTVLVLLWGAYAFVDGAFAIAAGIRSHGENRRWWVLLLEGILGVAAGIVAFAVPGITALVLLMLIAAWAIVTGVFEIVAAIQMRKYIKGEWLLILAGIASILFGVLLFINPSAGALAVIWLIAAYALVFGAILIALSLRLHGMVRSTDQMSPRAV